MQRHEHTIEIGAPRDRVFEWVTEPELMRRWVGGLKEFRPLDPRPGPGARAEQVVELAGRRVHVRSEILRYEPSEAVDARIRGKGFDVETAYRLEDLGPATLLRATVATRLHGVAGRLIGGVVDRQARRKLEADLTRLRQLVEAER
ncbi:MAG: SRPBCC family protein [Pseudomonadota bacterium]